MLININKIDHLIKQNLKKKFLNHNHIIKTDRQINKSKMNI